MVRRSQEGFTAGPFLFIKIMNEPLRDIRPGEVFYEHGEKLHYIGKVQSNEDNVHVFWAWNKWKRRRYYTVIPDDLLEIHWKYLKKAGQV